jgi:hypothetical protein
MNMACDAQAHTCTTACKANQPCNGGCCAGTTCAADCSMAPQGKVCFPPYMGTQFCGCNKDMDCPPGKKCNSFQCQ